jgi:hypothetical protein
LSMKDNKVKFCCLVSKRQQHFMSNGSTNLDNGQCRNQHFLNSCNEHKLYNLQPDWCWELIAYKCPVLHNWSLNFFSLCCNSSIHYFEGYTYILCTVLSALPKTKIILLGVTKPHISNWWQIEAHSNVE